MIKGILLGICASVFIVSFIFLLSGTFGGLQENIITGHAIGEGTMIGFSFTGLILSFILGMLVVMWIRRTYEKAK